MRAAHATAGSRSCQQVDAAVAALQRLCLGMMTSAPEKGFRHDLWHL